MPEQLPYPGYATDGVKTGDKATYLHGLAATDPGSVEHWQFYDGEARVFER